MEIATKRAPGRIDVPLERFGGEPEVAGFEPPPIRAEHGVAAGAPPRHHGDPFGRVPIARARTEGLTLVSGDAVFTACDVRLLGPG